MAASKRLNKLDMYKGIQYFKNKTNLIDWSRKDIARRGAKYHHTKKGIYVFEKDNNEPDFYNDWRDYAITRLVKYGDY